MTESFTTPSQSSSVAGVADAAFPGTTGTCCSAETSLALSKARFETPAINPLRTLRDHLLSPVIQFGPPRTGSTLVWNAIRAIRSDLDVPKRHTLSFLHRSTFCRARIVGTVRDPLDIITSMLSISDLEPSPQAVSSMIEEVARQGISDAIWLKGRPNSLILRYEDFYENFGALFDALEGFLETTASASERTKFEDRFNIDSVRRRAEALGRFDEFDHEDLIHGRHISPQAGRPGSHAGILDPAAIEGIRDRFADYITAFRY